MKLDNARKWVQEFARNTAGDTSVYNYPTIDRAIQLVAARFVRRTQCLRVFGAATLALDTPEVDLSALEDFRPERLLEAFVTTRAEALDRVAWRELHRNAVENTGSGTPEQIAFKTWSLCSVWPKPSAAGTLEIHYVEPFTTWNPGDDTNPTLNLPDDYLYEILASGVPAMLQHTELEKAFASSAWQTYLAYEREMQGAGNMAARTATRAMLEE